MNEELGVKEGKNKKMHSSLLKKISNIILSILIFIVFAVFCYYKTSTLHDFFMCILVAIISIGLVLILDFFMKKNIVNLYVTYFTLAIIMYFSFYILNLFLISHVSHILWIGPLIGSYFGSLRESNIKFSVEKFAILIIALTITMIGMFNIFDDNIGGVNKVERSVKSYLLTDKNYEKNDFDKIIFKQNYRKKQPTVWVSFKDEPNVGYVYKIIDNKVVQIEVDAMFTNKTEFKHIEDENIIIKNRS